MTDIEGRKRALQNRIDAAADELALLEKFESADFEVGTTLRWRIASTNSKLAGTTRVVIKQHDDTWFFPGDARTNHNIDRVVACFQNDDATEIEVAKKWKKLGE